MQSAYRTISGDIDTRVQRRAFLRSSLTTVAGLSGILLAKTPPAYTQERELKLITFSHFVSSSGEELKRQLEEYGKMVGVKVSMDRVEHLKLSEVYDREIQEQKGHDLVALRVGEPHLYAKYLVNLDELVEKIGRRAGGWTDVRAGLGPEGHYLGIPWFFLSFPIAVRTDLIAEIGEDLPDTWEDVHRVGKKLKAKGNPLGIQLAHSEDSNHILRGIIWSWGGKLVEKDSKTVAINSKETIEAYKFVKALYQDCMEEEVLVWADQHNNACLNSGKCSMILNPTSAYNAARKDNALIPGTEKPIHQVIDHILPPKGPAGRHMSAASRMLGIWQWSPLQEVAKGFLDFHFQKEQQEKHLTASLGYNQPFLRSFGMHPIYASNPKLYFAPYIGWYTHAPGWPGSLTAATDRVWNTFIIPDTVAACATGKMTAEKAVQSAEVQIKRLYRRYAS